MMKICCFIHPGINLFITTDEFFHRSLLLCSVNMPTHLHSLYQSPGMAKMLHFCAILFFEIQVELDFQADAHSPSFRF